MLVAFASFKLPAITICAAQWSNFFIWPIYPPDRLMIIHEALVAVSIWAMMCVAMCH